MRPCPSVLASALAVSLLALACSSTGDAPASPAALVTTGDAQTPPTNGAADATLAWLKSGTYKAWKCEPAPHAPRVPSVHGVARECANTLVSGGTYPFNVGAANVIEYYPDAAATAPSGYGITVRVLTGSAKDAWYYAEVKGGALGSAGRAFKDTPGGTCADCHIGAGTPTYPSGGDSVFSPVR